MTDIEVHPTGTGIHYIDTGYIDSEMAAAWIVLHQGQAAVVEVNTTHAVPRILAGLRQLGLEPADVRYVVVTHIHLDHAGGAGALLRELPRARLAVHPRGERHLVDPSRLVAGATAVYGEDKMAALYGEVVPVPRDRILATEDEMTLDLAGRRLHVLHTPGHARHHQALWDPRSGGLWTGDVYGLCYPKLATPSGPFPIPTTAPPQYDPVAMHESMARLEALHPRRLLLTHFGPVPWTTALGERIRDMLEAWNEATARAVERYALRQDQHSAVARALVQDMMHRYRQDGGSLPAHELEAALTMDAEINAMGLVHRAQS